MCELHSVHFHLDTSILSVTSRQSNEAFVLTLLGKKLDVSLLVNRKMKFRTRGGRDGALDAMRQLEIDGMGKLVLKKSKGSIKVCAPLNGTCTMLNIL